jgi:hypothetical protein
MVCAKLDPQFVELGLNGLALDHYERLRVAHHLVVRA